MENIWILKLESPPYFEVQHDMEKVESWVCYIENYFVIANVQNSNLKAMYTTLLLTKSSALWLYPRGFNL